MAVYTADLTPKEVPRIHSKYRRIVTKLPVPETLPMFEELRKYEPRSMGTQVPIVWDRADGFQVEDGFGNRWIDFTSGILVANSGHSHPHIIRALKQILRRKLLHSYLFATKARAGVVKKLVEMSPENLTKVFLLSTGSESMECAVKLARLYGLRRKPEKRGIVSFAGSFHGRTMGSQMLSSMEEDKRWITCLDPDIHQIPFPRCPACPWGRDSYNRCGEECLEKGLEGLRKRGVDLDGIAAFVLEGYQGIRGPIFCPDDFAQALRRWADAHEALVVVDEIQSGFGRTGRLFAYQHYGIDADLVCCGKGVSSSLPLSAVLGRGDILDLAEPGQMTSTHTGNPACCAATLASLEVLERENLVEAAAEKGRILENELKGFQEKHPDRINLITGRGMVFAFFLDSPETRKPDIAAADRVVETAIQRGVMLFITGNGSVKICPPLNIPVEPLVEGVRVIGEALEAVL